MKILKNIIFTVLVLFGLSTIAQSKQSPTLIVFNAKVHTLDNANTIAEAIAVQNGKIIKVGKSSSILKLKTKNTKLVDAKGKTIVPLKLYFKNRYAKLEIGICQGKDQQDKRQDIMTRDTKLEMARIIKMHR